MISLLKKYRLLIYLVVFALTFSSCKIYSFTGASIPAEAKTVSIDYFPNNAILVAPSMSQTLTQALKDKFQQETNLSLVTRDGDLHFEGAIMNYSINPVSIQSDETAAQNRYTVKVKVKFMNVLEDDKSYETTITEYLDYSTTQSQSQVEESFVDDISERIVEAIFNKAVVNW